MGKKYNINPLKEFDLTSSNWKATEISFTPYDGIASTTVQGAIQEVADERAQKPVKTYTISPTGGDYTTIQAALTANPTEYTLFIVYPGAYLNDTINYTANNQSVIGMDNSTTQIIGSADASVVNFSTYTGCVLNRLTVRITGATSAIGTINGSTGSIIINDSTVEMTNSNVVTLAQPCCIKTTGAATVTFLDGFLNYTNNVATTAGAGIKTAVSPGLNSITTFRRVVITLAGAGASELIIPIYAEVNCTTEFYRSKINVTDLDTTAAIGFSYINGAGGTGENFSNTCHVNCGAGVGHEADGLVAVGTRNIRSMFNHIHLVGNTQYPFQVDTGCTVTSMFDDILSTGASITSGTGALTYVNSIVDGNLKVSGTGTFQSIVSNVATGTAPLVVASKTLVNNLNSDLLDSQEGSYYLDLANASGTLAVGKGGTGLSSYAVGDILYASGTGTIGKLADVAVGQVLTSGGVGVAPAYSASPTLTNIKLTGLADGRIPYHINDATGFGNSPFRTNGSDVGIEVDPTLGKVHIYHDMTTIPHIYLDHITSNSPSNKDWLKVHSSWGPVSGGLRGQVTSGVWGLNLWAWRPDAIIGGDLTFSAGYGVAEAPLDNIRMTIKGATGNVGIGTTNPGYLLQVANSAGAIIDIKYDSLSPASGQFLGALQFSGKDSLGGTIVAAKIESYSLGSWGTGPGTIDHSADLRFYTSENNTAIAERMRITDTGNVGIGTTAPDKALEINSATGVCLRLTYNDANGSAVNYVDFAVSSSGDLTITPSGGDITLGGNLTMSAKNIITDTITGTQIGTGATQKLGLWGVTPAVRPAAFTQTYSTASHTVTALTIGALTDNTGGTADTTLAAVEATYTQATIRNNFADLAAMVNKNTTDLINLYKVVTAIIDDLQTYGALQ